MNIFMRFDFFVPETMPQNKATSRKIQLYRILTQNQQDDEDGYRVVWFLLRGGPDSGDGGRRPPRLLKSQIKHSYIYSHQSTNQPSQSPYNHMMKHMSVVQIYVSATFVFDFSLHIM